MPNTIISRKEYQEMENLTPEERTLVAKIRGLEKELNGRSISGRFGNNIVDSGKAYFGNVKKYIDEINNLKKLGKNELILQYINEGKTRQKIQSEIKDNLLVKSVSGYVEKYSSDLAEEIFKHSDDYDGKYTSSLTNNGIKNENAFFVWEAMKFYQENREITAELANENEKLEEEEGIALSEEYTQLQAEYLSMNEFCANPVTEQNAETYFENYLRMPQVVERIGEISKRASEINDRVKNPSLFSTARTYQQEYKNNKQNYLAALENYIDGIENGEAVKQFHTAKSTINVEIKQLNEKNRELHNKLENQYNVNLMTEKKALEADYKSALERINFETDSKDINARIVSTLAKEKYNAIHNEVKQDYKSISDYNRSKEKSFNNDYENHIEAIRSASKYAEQYVQDLFRGKTNVKESMENQLREMNEKIEQMREFGEKTGKPFQALDASLKSLSSLREQAAAAIIESQKTDEEKFIEANIGRVPLLGKELDQKLENLGKEFEIFDAEKDEKTLISKWQEINKMYEGKDKPAMPEYIGEFKKIKNLPENIKEQIKQVDEKYKALEVGYIKFSDKIVEKVYTPYIKSNMEKLESVKDGVITDKNLNLAELKNEVSEKLTSGGIHSENPSGMKKNLLKEFSNFFKTLNEKSAEVENRIQKAAEERAKEERKNTKAEFENKIKNAWERNGEEGRPLYENFFTVRKRLDEINKDSLISKEDKEYCNNLFKEQVVEPYIEKCLDERSNLLRENAKYMKILLDAEKADMASVDKVSQAFKDGRANTKMVPNPKNNKLFMVTGPLHGIDITSKDIFDDIEKVNNTDFGIDPEDWKKHEGVINHFKEALEIQMILGMDAKKIDEVVAKVDKIVTAKKDCEFLYEKPETRYDPKDKKKKNPIAGKVRIEELKEDFDKKSPSYKDYEKDCKLLADLNTKFEKQRNSYLNGKSFDEKALKTLEDKYKNITDLQNKLERYDLFSAKAKNYPKVNTPEPKKIDQQSLKAFYKTLDNKVRDFYSIGNVDRKQIVEEVEKGISRLDMLGIKGKDYDDYKDFVDCYYADERRKGLANDFETFAKEDIKKEKMNFKELQEEMEKYDGFKEPKKGVTKKDVSAVKDALIRENAYAK